MREVLGLLRTGAAGDMHANGVDRPVPRWSKSSTRKSLSARFIQPLGGLVGRVASCPGPPWKYARYGLFSPPSPITSRVKTSDRPAVGRVVDERHRVLALHEVAPLIL